MDGHDVTISVTFMCSPVTGYKKPEWKSVGFHRGTLCPNLSSASLYRKLSPNVFPIHDTHLYLQQCPGSGLVTNIFIYSSSHHLHVCAFIKWIFYCNGLFSSIITNMPMRTNIWICIISVFYIGRMLFYTIVWLPYIHICDQKAAFIFTFNN